MRYFAQNEGRVGSSPTLGTKFSQLKQQLNMSYNKDLESNKLMKQKSDLELKKQATDRLKKVADAKKRRKAGKLI